MHGDYSTSLKRFGVDNNCYDKFYLSAQLGHISKLTEQSYKNVAAMIVRKNLPFTGRLSH